MKGFLQYILLYFLIVDMPIGNSQPAPAVLEDNKVYSIFRRVLENDAANLGSAIIPVDDSTSSLSIRVGVALIEIVNVDESKQVSAKMCRNSILTGLSVSQRGAYVEKGGR